MNIITNVKAKFEYFIDIIVTFIIILLASIPIIEVIIRVIFSTGIIASYSIMRHIVLWIAFIGSYLATIDGKHLAIDISKKYIPEKFKKSTYLFCKIIEISTLLAFFIASIFFKSSLKVLGKSKM
jgi:TRAP-type C4-dicarboxylate transport system permease small subunit